ncbi:hypothetical protein EYF80_002431 [Liparis tanakae]|uniref:Uncharacterized protein n=1 Tax=Liparis tanakae TaxID=230148 RepID=A0A4Z2JAI4_9TELE|nr:hypothetical protein EYF80_002431 [Liparis tanakae]
MVTASQVARRWFVALPPHRELRIHRKHANEGRGNRQRDLEDAGCSWELLISQCWSISAPWRKELTHNIMRPKAKDPHREESFVDFTETHGMAHLRAAAAPTHTVGCAEMHQNQSLCGEPALSLSIGPNSCQSRPTSSARQR